MRVLILEDSPERIKTFQKKLWKHDLYFFDNVDDTIKALEYMDAFDVLFLDHDLGGQVFVDSDEPNTGYQLAKYIKEKQLKFNQVVIHSMNPVGAQRMKDMLPEATIAPFTTLF